MVSPLKDVSLLLPLFWISLLMLLTPIIGAARSGKPAQCVPAAPEEQVRPVINGVTVMHCQELRGGSQELSSITGGTIRTEKDGTERGLCAD